MSTVEVMGIQGIRSFGPDAEDFQKVQFFKPLTLILGPNGTGKTTIIECLKFATIGEYPPGSRNSGSYFVHDPKLAKEREVKGLVKLMVRDISGAVCTVERPLSSKMTSAKTKKITTNKLDGVLTRINRDNEKQSVTSRCVDLNREMIEVLGVSKAVIENVIFCHQEDSNWPLAEGKSVKEKFDAIFAATRYSKVLKELKTIKEKHDRDISEGKKELMYLKLQKDKSHELKGDLEELQTKLAVSEDNVRQIEEKLSPIKERLLEINANAAEIFELQTTRNKLQNQKEEKGKNIQDLSSKISEEYEGTTSDLEQELKEFSSQVEKKKRELSKNEKDQERITTALDKLSRDMNALLLEEGKLQNEAETHKANIKKRDAKLKVAAEEYDFEGFASLDEISDQDYRRFFDEMKNKLQNMMEDAKIKKAEFEEKEKTLQEKIDSLRESKAKLESSEKMKKDTVEKNKAEIKDLTKKLTRMVSSEGRLTTLNTELRRAENDLQATEGAVNVDDLRNEITALDRKKRQLDASISELNSEMNRLHKQSGARTQLEMLQNSLDEKQSTINRLRATHQDNIVSLLGHMPVDDLREAIDSYISTQSETYRRCTASMQEMKTTQSTKEMERTTARGQLNNREEELRNLERKIEELCEGQDLEVILTEVQTNLSNAQDEKGSMLGVEHMYKRYIRNLEKNNPDCPLCHRGFERGQEARELILKLQNDMRKVPANMRRAEENVERYQKQYDNLMQLRPQKERITVLKETEIPNLKVDIKKIDEEVKKIKEQYQNKDDALMAVEMDLETAKTLQPDVVQMDRYKGEMKELERKIESQRAMLSGGDSNRSMDAVIAEKEEKQLELDNTNRSLDHKREKLSDHQDLTLKLRNKVHQLKGEKLQIEGELQEKTKLEERKANLLSDNTTYQREIEEARTQLRPIENQIERVSEEKTEVVRSKEKMMEEARMEVDAVKNKGNGVKNINTEIKNYLQSGSQDRLIKCEKKKAQVSQTQAQKEEEEEELSTRINQLRKDIADQQVRERMLRDSLDIRNMTEEVKEIDEKIRKVTEKLGGHDAKNLERERQRLRKEEDTLTEDKQRATGRQQGFRDQIREKKKELESDMYKNAEERYRAKVIDNKTLEMANTDLQKYYKAMDLAIMRYHNTKMEEINIIIRELWKNTYMGNDIETIEIRSENDEEGASLNSRRRSYNYRVVMIKNGIPIDMRGCCSAGQKVLASLIIRLALAETFCVNCGVLALDEPTTNLDRANIESLAFALVQIIKDRRSQSHFQLVIITHDEDFVELLGRADFVDQYIQVSKNPDGVSRLTMKKVEELHSGSR